jgi:hypothetical protein
MMLEDVSRVNDYEFIEMFVVFPVIVTSPFLCFIDQTFSFYQQFPMVAIRNFSVE